MERRRLEVILEAVNRAGGPLREFGGQVEGAVNRANRSLASLGDRLKTGGMDLSLMRGHAGGLARAMIFLGTAMASPLLGVIGILQLAAGGMAELVSLAGRAAAAIAHFGLEVLRWLGQVALSAIGSLLNAVRTLTLALAALGVGAVVSGVMLARSFLGAAGQMERYEAQFRVLMGSAAGAREELKKLMEFAAVTPFTLPEVIDADLLLKAFQLDLGGTTETLRILGDAATAMHVPLQQVVDVLAKAKAGVFEIQEFAPVGITREQLEAAGMQFKATGEPVNRGQLLAASVQALSRFAGTMKEMAGGLEQRLSNLSDAWFRFQAAVGAPLKEGAKRSIQALADALDRMQDNAKRAVAALSAAFGPLFSRAVQGAVWLFERLVQLGARIAESEQFQALAATVTALFDRAQEVVGGFLDWLSENWQTTWDWVAERVSAAADWIAGAVGGVWAVLQELGPQIWDWAQNIADAGAAAAKSLYQSMVKALGEVAKLLASYMQLSSGMLKDIAAPTGWAAKGLGWTMRGAARGVEALTFGKLPLHGLDEVGKALAGANVEGAVNTLANAAKSVSGWSERAQKALAQWQSPNLRESWQKTVAPGGALGGLAAAYQQGAEGGRLWMHNLRDQAGIITEEGRLNALWEAAGWHWEQVGNGTFLFTRDAMDKVGHAAAALAKVPPKVTHAADAVAEAAKHLGSAARAAQAMSEAMARAAETQAAFTLPEHIQRFGLLARMFEATGATDLAKQARIEQVRDMQQYGGQLMAGLGKAGGMVSLTTLENATEAVEQNREMLITLGKALAPKAMGGGPAWNLRGTQIAGAAAQLTDEDYIRMAQRALGQYEWSELGRLTQRVPYPPPVQYGAFDIEGLQAFGRPPRFGPPGEIQGSGVVINCPITIWEANDREAVKAIVDAEIHTAIDKAWDEQVGLEAQVAGWPS